MHRFVSPLAIASDSRYHRFHISRPYPIAARGIRNSGSTRAGDNHTPERNELIALRRRNRRLEMEVDVSEQAAPVFARKQA